MAVVAWGKAIVVTIAGALVFLLVFAATDFGQPNAGAQEPTATSTVNSLFDEPTPTPIPSPTSIFDGPGPEATPTPLFLAPTVEPTATPLFTVPTATPTPVPTSTAEPTATATARPAPVQPAPTAVPAAPEPTQTPEPELTPTPEATSEPAVITDIDVALDCPAVAASATQIAVSIPSDVAGLVATEPALQADLAVTSGSGTLSPSGIIEIQLDDPLDPGPYELTLTGELLEGTPFSTTCAVNVLAPDPTPAAAATPTAEPSGSQVDSDSGQADEAGNASTDQDDDDTSGVEDGETTPGTVTITTPTATSGGPNRVLLGVIGVGLLAVVVLVSAARFFMQR